MHTRFSFWSQEFILPENAVEKPGVIDYVMKMSRICCTKQIASQEYSQLTIDKVAHISKQIESCH